MTAAATFASAAAARPEHAATLVNLGRALLADCAAGGGIGGCGPVAREGADEPGGRVPARHGAECNGRTGAGGCGIAVCRRARSGQCGGVAQPGQCRSPISIGWTRRSVTAATAIRLAPDLAEAHASLGFVLTVQGRLDEAIAASEAAVAVRPDFAQAHWNLAVAALLAGDFALGFREYEWRKRHDRFRRDFVDLPGPQWDGTDPVGLTILVHAEQGLGDTIQFARYLPLIAARGGHAVLACERPLIPLLAGNSVTVVAKDAPPPPYDCWIDQMSLPRVFATRLDTIPAPHGYLRADPIRTAAWRASLPAGPNVGLAWAGNPAHSNDRRRSIPAATMQRILAVPGVNFVNLQVGSRAGDIGLVDMSPLLSDYAETAALIAALDLLITVDTSVAHVAGALGKPAWVMLPYAPDWRWLLGRNDTPWYASLRLFRQPRPGDWDAVIMAVANALAARALDYPIDGGSTHD